MGLKVVSYSELVTARRCPLKHQLAYVERWTKAGDPMSALGKGSAWHTVMEGHYIELMRLQKAGETDEAKILAFCSGAVDPLLEQMPPDLATLIEWMYKGYVECHGTDPGWEILAVEFPAQVRLPTPRGTPSGFYLKMKIDLIARERRTRNVKVIDHKSGKDLPNNRAMELDDQFGLYVWGLRQLGRRVFGQEWNAARTLRLQEDIKAPGTTPLDKRFARLRLHRTDKELDIVAREAYLTASTRYAEQARVTRMGVDSPRHTDPVNCQWQCDFFEPCMAGRKGINIRQFLHDKGFAADFTRH
jgi:hypothetical protein